MSVDADFGRRIRVLRVGVGISQKSLGRAVGMAEETVRHTEAGRRAVKLREAVALAEFFGVTMDEITGSVIRGTSTWEEETVVGEFLTLPGCSAGGRHRHRKAVYGPWRPGCSPRNMED